MSDLPLLPPIGPLDGEPTVVSLYELATGRIIAVMSCERNQVAGNVPAGCSHVAGRHDGTKRRVNLATLEVEPYQPPQPDADHVWNATEERWELPAAVLAQRTAALRRQREIEAIELATLRALREYALGDASALARLQQADDEVKSRRVP